MGDQQVEPLKGPPDAGPPRIRSWQEGTQPVMLNGTLYFVDSRQTVQALGAKDVAPVARFERVSGLTADPAGIRLFAVPTDWGKGETLFYLRR